MEGRAVGHTQLGPLPVTLALCAHTHAYPSWVRLGAEKPGKVLKDGPHSQLLAVPHRHTQVVPFPLNPTVRVGSDCASCNPSLKKIRCKLK
eukprot:366225-Chlamydomonas_euryale.AAC.9